MHGKIKTVTILMKLKQKRREKMEIIDLILIKDELESTIKKLENFRKMIIKMIEEMEDVSKDEFQE